VAGTTSTAFEPSNPVSRGQAATFFANTLRAAGFALPPAPAPFADVAGTEHADSIGRLAAAGIVRGYDDGRYRPGGVVTREQVAALLVRAYDAVAPEPLPAPGARRFVDIATSVHARQIDRADAAGLVSGTSATTFSPADPISRAQAAAMLTRLLRRFATSGIELTRV
jgi:hypothetical protein